MKAMNTMKSWFKSVVALVALVFGFAAHAGQWYVLGEKGTTYTTKADAMTAASDDETKVYSLWDGTVKSYATAETDGDIVYDSANKQLVVETAVGLQSLSGLFDKHPELDDDQPDWTLVINSNIDFDNRAVVAQPLGGYGLRFNGRGHTIMNYALTDNSNTFVGLIQVLNHSVSNVIIRNAQVTASDSADWTGAFVGLVKGGIFKDVKLYGSTVSGRRVGGIAGNLMDSEADVSGCVVEDSTITAKYKYVGGIASQITGVQEAESDNYSVIANNSFKNVTLAWAEGAKKQNYGVIATLINDSNYNKFTVRDNVADNITYDGELLKDEGDAAAVNSHFANKYDSSVDNVTYIDNKLTATPPAKIIVGGTTEYDNTRAAMDAAAATSGTTVDFTTFAYKYAAPVTSGEGACFNTTGTYTLKNGNGALFNYEVQLNSEKQSVAPEMIVTNAHLAASKLNLYTNAKLSVVESTLDFDAFDCGCSYFGVKKNGDVTIKDSTVGNKTVGHSGYANFFGPATTIYGTVLMTNSTLYTSVGQGNDGLDVYGNGQLVAKDSTLKMAMVNLGTDLTAKYFHGDVPATTLASIVLDNAKMYNTQYAGDQTGLRQDGIIIGKADSGYAGALTLKNGSLVDLSTANGKQNIAVTANGTIAIDATSQIKCNAISNAGVIEVDMTGATADSYTLIDAAAASTYGTYQFATGKANGYELKVVDNDLIAAKPPVAKLYKGEELVGSYTTISSAVSAWNGADEGDYTIKIEAGTYYEGDLCVFQKTNRVLTVKANGNVVLSNKGTTKGIIFMISGSSSYAGAPVTFEDIRFDLSETTADKGMALYFGAGGSGTPDPYYGDVTAYSDKGTHRHAHSVTAKNCECIGNSDQTSQFMYGVSGGTAFYVSIVGGTYSNLGYVVNAYINCEDNYNDLLTIDGATVTNTKVLVNNQATAGNIVVRNCPNISTYHDYVIRNYGDVSVSDSTFNNTNAGAEAGGFFVFRTGPEANVKKPTATLTVVNCTMNRASENIHHAFKDKNSGVVTINDGTSDVGTISTKGTYFDFSDPVAQVISGGVTKKYATLEAAFAAAKNGDTVELLADIDLEGAAWTPATFNYKTFDGKGHKVSNFTVMGEKAVGFFGNADCSTIKNLTIENATVNGINHVGAVAGRGMCTKIENCTAKNCAVTTSVKNNDDGDKAGGICGYLSGEPNAWVKDCLVTGCTITGYRDVGGAVGIANVSAVVSGNVVTNVTVINDKSVNYKGYTTDAQYNVHEVVGNKAAAATVEGNTVTNVEVVQPKMVAKIGFKEYETLQAALAAAQKDDTVELLADIDLEGAAWTPVAFGYKTFDGKGHKISNFTATGEKNVGFFGTATCSTIKNLTVENATVSGINHVAAIAGDGLCAKIENCTAKNCSVTASVKNNDDGDKAAGICGYLSGEPNAWVKNCLVTDCMITGYRDCGGAVGYANGGAVVSGTTVKDTTIVNDRSNNYKGYTKNAEFDIHEIVGEVVPTASVTGNTADNVKILGMVYAVQIGDKGYEALEDAVGAVQNGETILLLANNAEVFTAGTTALFVIDPTNFTFTASNVTPLEGCELVGNLDGTYTYRMKVVVKDQITKNVVETKVEDEVVAAAVAITDDNFGTIFKETGSKELEVVASGVGTVSFNSAAVDQIGANMKTVIAAVGGEEESATTKTTLTVAIADVTEEVKEEKPEIIITPQGNLEVVQAISVTAIMRTIVQQAGSSETVSTNDEVFAQGKTIPACVSTVTIPYSGIAPQVWYVDTTVAPWTTNAMDTAYNADTKELSFAVAHFSDYVITDAETYAMVGAEKFRTLQEAFDWVEADQTQGTTITLTKTNTLTSAATFDGALATLNLNGKAIVGSIAAGAGSILTVTNGTIDAGSAVFASGAATAKIYLVGGTYLGQFPDPSGLATNAGPLLVSGGKFQHEIPWAYCAPGYEPNPTPVGGFYTVKNAKIYIRDISACQRYPWNGYVDITLDVCWDDEVKAKLYASAWDLAGATPAPIAMKNATLLEEGVSGSRSVNCEKGFEVTAPEKKTLHLIWNSADEGVPTGTKRERVGFKFMSKRVNAN